MRFRARQASKPSYPKAVLTVALLGLVASNFMVSVLAAVVGPLAEEFETTTSTMIWVVLGPNLGFAVLAVTAGKLADLYGRRRAFLVALFGSMIFGGLSALAWSPLSLIAFRTVSAIFGSATGPAGVAIVAAQFERAKRIKVMGAWAFFMALGPVAGIIIGGPVVDQFSWRWLFVAQIPLTLLAIVPAILILPETTRFSDTRFDWIGTVLLAAGSTIFLFVINRGPLWGWSHPTLVGLLILTPVLFGGFYLQERRAVVPLIPVTYFRQGNFALPLISQFLIQFSYMGAGFVLVPLFLTEVLDYSATRASLLVTSRPGFFAIAGLILGFVGQKLGERTLSIGGALLVALSTFGLSLMNDTIGDWFVFAMLGVAGFGLGMMMPSLTAAMTNAVQPEDMAMAGGAQQMMLQMGTVAGIQILASVQVTREAVSGAEGSFAEAFTVGGVVAVVGALFSLGIRRTS